MHYLFGFCGIMSNINVEMRDFMNNKLEFTFIGSKGNKVEFYIKNTTNKNIDYYYSCKVVDKDNKEVMSKTSTSSYLQNRRQHLESNCMVRLSVEVSRDISDGMVFICELWEYDSETNENYSGKYSYRADVQWNKV